MKRVMMKIMMMRRMNRCILATRPLMLKLCNISIIIHARMPVENHLLYEEWSPHTQQILLPHKEFLLLQTPLTLAPLTPQPHLLRTTIPTPQMLRRHIRQRPYENRTTIQTLCAFLRGMWLVVPRYCERKLPRVLDVRASDRLHSR